MTSRLQNPFAGRVPDGQTERTIASLRAAVVELQNRVRALACGGGWELVGVTTAETATTELQLAGSFDGDRDVEYRIDLELLADSGLPTADIRLKPNRTTAAAFESTTFSTASLTSTIADKPGTWTLVSGIGGSTHMAGRVFVLGRRRVFGRWFYARGGFGTPSSAFRHWEAAGHWNDTTTLISSMSIDATTANKIVAGTVVSVYRRPA